MVLEKNESGLCFRLIHLFNVIACDNIIVRHSGKAFMPYEIIFYETEQGKSPVYEFLMGLDHKMRGKAAREIGLLAIYGPALHGQYVKQMKEIKNRGLFELRVQFASDISRIFYFSVDQQKYILLHGFIKKTLHTPESELRIARNRKIDYERRFNL